MRKQRDQVDIFEIRKGIDRSTPGVARGRDDDRGALAALGQHVIHQPRDQLHRDVLERQGRAVEQLEHELMRADLVQRHHGGMTESGVGLVRHAAEVGVRNVAGNERAHHVDGDLPIGPAEEGGCSLTRKLRPNLGHVEAAVPGKPGQHHVAETQRRSLAPGRNVPRQTTLQRLFVSLKPLILLNDPRITRLGSVGTIVCFAARGKRVLGVTDHPPSSLRAKRSNPESCRDEGLDCFVASLLAMTSKSIPAAQMRPGDGVIHAPRKTEGAGNAGRWPHPQASWAEKRGCPQVGTGKPKHPALPAQWFTAYFALSPESGLVSLRRPLISAFRPQGRNRISTDLIPASGDHDHAT